VFEALRVHVWAVDPRRWRSPAQAAVVPTMVVSAPVPGTLRGRGLCDAQGHLLLVPLRALNERLRCHGTRMWTVAEIGSGVAWSVLPNWSLMNVFE
jgi:hypothetical protein